MYASATRSLAALEFFVNLDPSEAPGNLVAVPAEILETIPVAHVDVSDLPRGWRAYPAPASLADLGAEWVRSGKTAVLSVPSTVIPQERNYLLNPAHRDFKAIRIGTPEPFSFDPRMWRR